MNWICQREETVNPDLKVSSATQDLKVIAEMLDSPELRAFAAHQAPPVLPAPQALPALPDFPATLASLVPLVLRVLLVLPASLA